MLDEAIDLAKTVLNSNRNSILLVLQPMLGGNSPQQAVMKNRRALEDKLMAKLGLQYPESEMLDSSCTSANT